MGALVSGMGAFGPMSAGLNLASTAWQTNEAEKEAQANREFEQGSRATAYQTAVKDMEAAGLNPAMMYDKGGSSPPVLAGSSPSMPSAARPGSDLMEGMVSSAQAELLKANADKASAEAAESRARTPTYGVQMDKLQADMQEIFARIPTYAAQSTRDFASAAEATQHVQVYAAMIPQIKAATQQLVALAQLNDAQRQQAYTQAGLNMSERSEIDQRVTQNLPQLQRALMDLERIEGQARQPSALNDANVQDGFLGTLGSVLRTLNPFNSYFRSSTGGTTVNKSYTNIIRK